MRDNVTWTLLFTGILMLWGTGCEQEPEPTPDDPKPSLMACSALSAERECFALGCHFFASASLLDFQNDTCNARSGVGTCLYAPESEGAPDRLTFYQRTLDDGTVESLQLNVDTPVEGWTRCGNLDAPPDCDCDGLADTP